MATLSWVWPKRGVDARAGGVAARCVAGRQSVFAYRDELRQQLHEGGRDDRLTGVQWWREDVGRGETALIERPEARSAERSWRRTCIHGASKGAETREAGRQETQRPESKTNQQETAWRVAATRGPGYPRTSLPPRGPLRMRSPNSPQSCAPFAGAPVPGTLAAAVWTRVADASPSVQTITSSPAWNAKRG